MIIRMYNQVTDKEKKLLEADYKGKTSAGAVLFNGINDYDEKTYRLKFDCQEELKSLIEDLIEIYNSREEAA